MPPASRQASAFAAVSSGDNSNIIAARVARESFGVQKVVARIYDSRRAEVYERLGIPTVASVPWTTSKLLKTVLGEGTSEAWRDPSGAVALVTVTPNEGWVGHRLTDFEAASGARIALVTRFGTGQLPLPSTLIQSGDTLHVLTTDGDLGRAATDSRTSHRTDTSDEGRGRRRRRGRAIDRARAARQRPRRAADRQGPETRSSRSGFPARLGCSATPVKSTTSSRRGLADYEVVVGATGDDKVNLVISLLAKTEFAVRRVVARINHPANEWLFTEAWGVDVAVSTPRVLAALVEEAVTVGDLVRLFTIREGQANLIEITLPDGAPCAGTPVRDLNLPTDAALVAIVRGHRVIVPTPEEPLEGGDELLFVALPESEPAIREAVCAN